MIRCLLTNDFEIDCNHEFKNTDVTHGNVYEKVFFSSLRESEKMRETKEETRQDLRQENKGGQSEKDFDRGRKRKRKR